MSPEIMRSLFPKSMSWRISRLMRRSTAFAVGVQVFTGEYLKTFREVVGNSDRLEKNNEL